MSMERWNPFREIETMRQAMDRWLDERGLNNVGPFFGDQAQSMAIDLNETENGYELTTALPGVKPENIEINVDRDLVTVRGRTDQNEERQQGNYIYRERHSGAYQRSIRLPEPVNSEQVEATMEEGVLKITLPRLQQTVQRRIKVRSGAEGRPALNQPTSGGETRANNQPTDAATQANPSQRQTNQAPGQSSPMQSQSGAPQGQTQSLQRPAALNNMSSTQMDELERQVSQNDRQGFGKLAGSYGWNPQTTEQVWHYMTHRVSKDEVNRAFGDTQQA
jgi:HSP20 family protein